MAQTSTSTPVVYYDINLQLVAQAQRDYPCNVKE